MEKLHIQPSEIDALPYYEFEYTMEMYEEIIKERNENEDKQKAEYENDYNKKYNINSMQNNAMRNISKSPKLPKIPSIKMPHI